MAIPTRITDFSTTPGSNFPAGTETIGTAWDDYMRAYQAVVRNDLASKGADIASAGTTDLGAVAGLMHDVTGTVSITNFGTVSAGVWKFLKFEGALVLTHNATSLILPGGESIATADGDIGIFISEGSGNWRCISYFRAAASPNAGFITGDVKITIRTTADGGWVLMDDKTIGNGTSSATGRANADTSALFTLLWNNTVDADCAVSTGRGANAAADFAASKTIALPKSLGRALACYGAGSGLTSRAMAKITGTETHALSIAELAAHTHQETIATSGGGPSAVSGVAATGQAATDQFTLSTGSGTAHPNMQPSVFLNVMIKL